MSDCYTHNPYVPYMPDINHVDSCPHTAVDNNTMLSAWCALGSLAVLIASVILCATRDTLTSHYAILLCSRFPSRDLYGFHPYHRRGKKPRSRTADQIRPVWFHRSLYYRSVPIFRTNLWRHARRITMAMAIVAPPPIWCIPTPGLLPRCFVLILKDSSGDLCRLVTPYKILLLLCEVVYRTEIIKASCAAVCHFSICLLR